MDASRKLLQQLTKDFSPHERKELVTMFAVIGVDAYLQRHATGTSFSEDMIKIEHGKCYSRLLKYSNHHNEGKDERKVSSKKDILLNCKKVNNVSSKHSRRHDGLNHYPFVDEFGSVEDALKVGSVGRELSKADALIDPILKHTIKKVYDEFKIGANGLKATDIPEALMGIRTQKFNFPFLGHGGQQASLEADSLASHRLISYVQWTQIVRRRVHQYIVDNCQINSHPSEMSNVYDNNEEAESDCSEGEIYDDEEWIVLDADVPSVSERGSYTKETASSLNRHATKKGSGGNSEKEAVDRSHIHTKPLGRKLPTKGAKSSLRDAARARADALQKMVVSSVKQKSFKLPDATSHSEPEKLVGDTRALILADKKHAQRVKASRQCAAAQVIASSKVSYLRDEDYGVQETSHEVLVENKSNRGKRSNVELGSGSAALEIANAFLSGSLGKELLHGEDTNQTSTSLDQKGAKYNMSYKLDVESNNGEEAGFSVMNTDSRECDGDMKTKSNENETEEYQSRYAQYSGKSKFESCAPLYDNKGQRFISSRDTDSKHMRQADDTISDGSEYYAENWRSTQGGWVADFGAPHTHTLSVKNNVDDFD